MLINKLLITVTLYQSPVAENDILKWEVDKCKNIVYKKCTKIYNLGNRYMYLLDRSDINYDVVEAVICEPYIKIDENKIDDNGVIERNDIDYYKDYITDIITDNFFKHCNKPKFSVQFCKLIIIGSVNSALLKALNDNYNSNYLK